MPSIQDQLKHTAAVAKFKVDQQVRISKIQSTISDLENQVNTQKSNLGVQAFEIFQKGELPQEELQAICNEITGLLARVEEQKTALEVVKNEQPPAAPVDSAPSYAPPIPYANQGSTFGAPTPAPAAGGLVCPNCHTPVPGKFCPNCGAEGVAAAPAPAPAPVAAGLVCPKCGTDVPQRFCPNCGTEGVARS